MNNLKPSYRVHVVPACEARKIPQLQGEWRALVGQHGAGDLLTALNTLYASPEWFDHCCVTRPDAAMYLALVRDAGGCLVGISPISIQNYSLRYEIKNRALAKKRLIAASIPEGCPILPDSPEASRELLTALLQHLPACDCIYMSSVPSNSGLWRLLTSDGTRLDGYRAYLPYGVRPWHWLMVRGSFDEYLQRMSSKARYNLRRTVKLAAEKGRRLDVIRVDAEDQVDTFLESAVRISRKSWQHRDLGPRLEHSARQKEAMADLARRGLLRAYLLRQGEIPSAFAIGYQFGGVFHFAETGFDESLSDSSPGTVLLYFLIEDLHRHKPPRAMNFGIGDATYKRRFGDHESADGAIICFRRTLVNWSLQASHSSFQSAVDVAKWLVRRHVKK